jgi:hypothetical protein
MGKRSRRIPPLFPRAIHWPDRVGEASSHGEKRRRLKFYNQNQNYFLSGGYKKENLCLEYDTVEQLPRLKWGESQVWFTSRKRLPFIKILQIPDRSSLA